MTAIGSPDGTHDILPDEIPGWRRIESVIREVMDRYGYLEVRPPMFEYTSLFHKATGEVTDIVEKEMFTVPRKGEGAEKDSLTFRPELTPGAIRMLIQNNLLKQKAFWKVWYLGAAFRYEKPQKGRQRQFHQVGVEAVGSNDPMLDVETIAVYADILRALGVTDFELRLNTMGCSKCRGAYREALRKFVEPTLAQRCENCKKRYERNVFRVLDCKADAKLNETAPAAVDHVCAECRAHFETVQEGLRAIEVPFAVDKRIVRGLDYYTRTVYEFSSSSLGAQNALGGGGRYDNLVAAMGGPDVGAVGFAAGLERLLIAMEAAKVAVPAGPAPDFYAIAVDDAARREVFRVAQALRAKGLRGDLDFEARSVKAQMRSADRAKARFALLIGAEEMAAGRVKVKKMDGGDERVVPLEEAARILQEVRS